MDDVVTHLPPVAATELAGWYRAADVVVVPSYSESFGLVALEAQACGTPVVAAGVGGLRTAVHDGVSGLLVAGHDPRDYATAISSIVASPGRRDVMGAAGVRHASRFGWGSTVDGILAAYADAIAEHRLTAAAMGSAL